MIKGIGVDITNNERFNDCEKLANRILSDKEIAVFSKINDFITKRNYLAVRFAAKEALFKATNISFNFKDVSILNNEDGSPYVLSNIEDDIKISLSHEKEYSIAYIIIQKKL